MQSSDAAVPALISLIALLAGSVPAAAQPPTDASAQATAGSWVDHDLQFRYMGFTSTYSCNGLIDKLRVLLRTSGARVEKISPECAPGYDVPDRLAHVRVKFSTLSPMPGGSSESASASGVWRSVQLGSNRPTDLRDGDCELVEQFRRDVLPLFATRDVHADVRCIAHQDTGPFSLSFEVFAPAAR